MGYSLNQKEIRARMAKQYKCRAITYAAWFWFAISAGAFIAAFLFPEAI